MSSFIVSEDVRVWIDESSEQYQAQQDRGRSLQPTIVDSAGKALSGSYDYDRWATVSPTGEVIVARSLRGMFGMEAGWYGGAGVIDDLLGGRMVYEFDPGFWEVPFRGSGLDSLGGGLDGTTLLDPVAGAVAPTWRPDGRGYALLEGTGAPITKGRIDLWEFVDGSRRHHGTLHALGLTIRGSLQYSADSRWILLQGDIQRDPALLIDTTTSRFVSLRGPDPVDGRHGLLDDLLGTAACSFCWYPPAGPNALLGVVATSDGARAIVFDLLTLSQSTLAEIRSPIGQPLYLWQPSIDAAGAFLVGVAAGLVEDSTESSLGGTPNSVAAVVDLEDGVIDAPLGHRMKTARAVKIHNYPQWVNPLQPGDATSLGELADKARPLPVDPLDDPDRLRLQYNEYLGTAVFLLSTVGMEAVVDHSLPMVFRFLDAADRTGADVEPGMTAWIASCTHGMLAERSWQREDMSSGAHHAELAAQLQTEAVRLGCEVAASSDSKELVSSLQEGPFQLFYNDYTEVLVTATTPEEVVSTYLRESSTKQDEIDVIADGAFLTDERGDHRLQLVLFEARDKRIAMAITVLADTDTRAGSNKFGRFAELALASVPSAAARLGAERRGAEMVETLLSEWRHVDPNELDWSSIQRGRRKKRFGLF